MRWLIVSGLLVLALFILFNDSTCPSPPECGYCSKYWKYGPSSINASNIDAKSAKMSLKTALDRCLLEHKCVGALQQPDGVIMLTSQPFNTGINTSNIYYEKR